MREVDLHNLKPFLIQGKIHLGICVQMATSFAGFTYPFLTLPAHLRSSPVTPVSFPFHLPPGVPQLD